MRNQEMDDRKEFDWHTSGWTRTISTKNALAHSIRQAAYASLRILVTININCKDDTDITPMLQCCSTITG